MENTTNLTKPTNVSKKRKIDAVLDGNENIIEPEKNPIREQMIREYETHLTKIKTEIERLNLMEVDFDNEDVDSPYERKCRLTAKYMEFYKKLCAATKCNYLTGRPIEKTISLTGVTRFPVLNDKVAQYINSQSISFIPDYNDILKVVQHENQGADLQIIPEEVDSSAEKLYKQTMKVLRARRHQDLHIAIPDLAVISKGKSQDSSVVDYVDPADNDESLRKKLEANRVEAVKESEVVEKFFKQANNLESDDIAESTDDESIDDLDDNAHHYRRDSEEENVDQDSIK